MFGENLATLRKQKGMSQEVLAQQLNVVRQTVSKWEKGLSVPDAEMLQRIAEVFDVKVDELLGSKINDQKDIDQIAAQLAILNEQLANKARRNRVLVRNVIIGIIAGFALILALSLTASYFFSARFAEPRIIKLTCIVNGETQTFEIKANENNKVVEISGDQVAIASLTGHSYVDSNQAINDIISYYRNHCDSLDYYCDDDNVSYYHDYHIEHLDDNHQENHQNDHDKNQDHHNEH